MGHRVRGSDEGCARLIVVPYTPEKLRPETAQWAASNNARLRDVSAAPEAYYDALCEWWGEAGDLLIVEHDMLPADGVVDEMVACSQLWCSSPYQLAHVSSALYSTLDGVTSERFSQKVFDHCAAGNKAYDTDGLGCTKFSADLKTQWPTLVVESGTVSGWAPHVWWLNDVRITQLLRRGGMTPHLHAPSIHLSVL